MPRKLSNDEMYAIGARMRKTAKILEKIAIALDWEGQGARGMERAEAGDDFFRFGYKTPRDWHADVREAMQELLKHI